MSTINIILYFSFQLIKLNLCTGLDDIDLDIPDSKIAVNYPKKGKDFEISFKIKEIYSSELLNPNSAQFNELRKRIQLAVLKLYADNDYYQDMIILRFRNQTYTIVDVLMRFTVNAIGHLDLLADALLHENINGLPTGAFFDRAVNADYNAMRAILCVGQCNPTFENQFPPGTCPHTCETQCCALSPIMANNNLPVTPVAQAIPMSYYSNNNIMAGQLCPSDCSNSCYPSCQESCCQSMARRKSFINYFNY